MFCCFVWCPKTLSKLITIHYRLAHRVLSKNQNNTKHKMSSQKRFHCVLNVLTKTITKQIVILLTLHCVDRMVQLIFQDPPQLMYCSLLKIAGKTPSYHSRSCLQQQSSCQSEHQRPIRGWPRQCIQQLNTSALSQTYYLLCYQQMNKVLLQ